MSYRNRKDAVHGDFVDGLRAAGIVVEEMPQPGDVLCYHEPDIVALLSALDVDPHRLMQLTLVDVCNIVKQAQCFVPMEFKTKPDKGSTFKNGRPRKSTDLTPRQLARQKRMPIPIVRSLAEALALFGISLQVS
jgi:hypothetical protein